jgi:molybdopterin-containing oxidoreductase family membrane subunit
VVSAAAELRAVDNQALLHGKPDDAALTTQLLAPTWRKMGRLYWTLLGIAAGGTLVLFTLAGYTMLVGIGLWGNNIPVGWAFGIINFVWWIGIGHAGTFISAILFLLEQRWRTSINRFTEAMTLFAVIQAGMFPVLHLGRPWFAYWLFPYPATMDVWPQLRSALPWDAAAVSTYFTTSLLFWYLGLVPDFATLRDRAPSRTNRIVYGLLALGWRGAASHYRHYRMAYLLLAGIATPLVLSVHSVVSLDFAISNLPGWHTTILPPFFVAGAIYSGFAMVLTWILPARKIFGLTSVITDRHIDNLAKVMFVTGWVVTYAYAIEIFSGWYSGDPFEHWTTFHGRPLAHGSVIFWLQMLCNSVIPQLLWSRRVRHTRWLLFVIAIGINVGMWSERFVIIVLSLQQDFLPSSWANYSPTWVDLGIFGGTICFFSLLFLLFLRFFPFVPVSEMKELKLEMRHEEAGH